MLCDDTKCACEKGYMPQNNGCIRMMPPTDQKMYEVFTTYSDNTICQGSMEWTSWKSASDVTDGNDFELLADHINRFG